MDKNNLISLAIKELKEMEVLVNGLNDLPHIPAVIFKLADAKMDNIKNFLDQLAANNEPISKPEKNSREIIAEVQEKEPEIIEPVKEKEPVLIVDEKAPVTTLVAPEITSETAEINTKQQIVVVEETYVEEKSIDDEVILAEKKTRKATIGEAIIEKKSSVNEMLSEKAGNTLDKSLGSRKITDLKKSINLNDKFRFQRELFNGDATLLNNVLDKLNNLNDKEEAFELLSSFAAWDHSNQTVIDFIELVNRKFL